MSDGATYLVRTQQIRSLTARIVMARQSEGVQSLYPNARVVFAILMFLAFAAAGSATWRARRIAGA